MTPPEVDRELDLARRIQLSLMPAVSPQVPGIEIGTAYRAARQIGGDFYDAYLHPSRPGTVGLAVADVTGKGITAALMMAFFRAVLRSAAYNGSGPADALQRANRVLTDDVHSGLFVTAFVAEIDARNGILRYASAGHEPPLLLGRSGVVELPADGILLGLFRDFAAVEHEQVLEFGDVVVAYTDGVTDARDPSGARFGEQRLLSFLRDEPVSSATDLADGILAAVDRFAGGAPPADDITVLTTRFVPAIDGA